MKKIVLMFVVVLMVLTSCGGNKSVPTYAPSETSTVKRVAKVGRGQSEVSILLENGVMLSDFTIKFGDPENHYLHELLLFVEPGDTIVYKDNEVVEVKFKN